MSRVSLRSSQALSPLVAGFLVVLVSYSGPMLVVKLAANNAGLSDKALDSWMFTVAVGSGVAGLVLSAWLRQPIVVAFSSAGAVLLTTSLQEYRFSDAIGAYLLVSVGCVVIGLTGTFSRLLARVPNAIISAMLAGVLFRFGTGYFSALPGNPVRWQVTALVVFMGVVYFVARARASRLAIVWTSGLGLVAALALQLRTGESVQLHLAGLDAVSPTFNLGAITGLGIPLLAIALSSQYAPGYAVLRQAGYQPEMGRILSVTGVIGGVLAPLGCPGINLAAITAGIATGPDAHPDPDRRYTAGMWTGAFYLIAGVFGASLLSVFSIVPTEFVAAVTGLALFGTIVTSAAAALVDPEWRDAAGVTLLCSAAGFTLFHVGSPFWALVAGLAVDWLMRAARRRTSISA